MREQLNLINIESLWPNVVEHWSAESEGLRFDS